MTFGNFILALRERLNDGRKSDASLITTFTDDGIRWTSAKLISIANQAFNEAIRLVAMYAKDNILKNAIDVGGLVQKIGGLTVASGELAIPNYVGVLLEVKVGTTSYGSISARYYENYVTDDTQPRNEGYFFTVLTDSSSGLRKILFIPTDTAGTAELTYMQTNFIFTSDDENSELPIYGIDDLLLDIAEREGREREYNMDRAQILENRIIIKLGIPIRR